MVSEPRSKHNEEDDGQPAMARPPIGVVDHGLATCKGATGCGQGPLHRGRLAAANPQGQLVAASPQAWQAPTCMAACSVAPIGAAGYRVAPAKGGHQH
ncbi:hypothetical protein B296_00034232 [Ensete ventricosum]|uniref:Uncharacterized protein n=1 Tax=Ensete ventricosum TaxID=4639 RepID=A0A426Y9I9_ENSVE|nr:hypothetical protein B296_00034232 [Ensete ventricosum]